MTGAEAHFNNLAGQYWTGLAKLLHFLSTTTLTGLTSSILNPFSQSVLLLILQQY
jgi:type IV secretion system protein VirD4